MQVETDDAEIIERVAALDVSKAEVGRRSAGGRGGACRRRVGATPNRQTGEE